MKKIIVIVQARMASTRLPGKVLKCIQGKTLLEHCLERLQQVPSVDQIVVATTLNSKDMSIINLCEQLEVKYYRGSESDVLSRFYEASLKFKADVIIRVNSDCPLIDPEVVESIISQFIEQQPNCDYISNILKQTYPRGMHTEIFSFKVLEEAYKEATVQSDREHVTPYIYLHPDRYQISHALYKPNRSNYRWTVDTEEDLAVVTKIIDTLYPINKCFTLADMLHLLDQHPEWAKINAHIWQKKI